MDITPEINCASCDQKVPIDRGYCPYCRTEIKSYWFEDQGKVKRAIPFSENSVDYLFIDGKKLSLENLNEIPYALRQCLMASRNKYPQQGFYRVLNQTVSLLEQLLSSDPSLPTKWDKWLDK